MKISKKSLLTTSGIFTVASLGLMFVSAAGNLINGKPDIELEYNPNNAIQHFQSVKVISSGENDDSSATIYKKGNLIGIETDYNFVISEDFISPNKISKGVRGSSILGGFSNRISRGKNHTILGGASNNINSGTSNSIQGGAYNTIENGENSVIIGGANNNMSGDFYGRSSSILGGSGNTITTSHSAIIGNENEVNGQYSLAMGTNSVVNGKNSFLWTNNNANSRKTINSNNVFAIYSDKGMVVNTTKPHTLAQLTISGSLIVYDDENAPECTGDTLGVLKVINGDEYNNEQKCFCSCNGNGWTALHEGTRCDSLCSIGTGLQAECGGVNLNCDIFPYSFTGNATSGACTKGKLVGGTGAFFVTTTKTGNNFIDYINRSCETTDGHVTQCNQKITESCQNKQKYECVWDHEERTEHIIKNNTSPIDSATFWEYDPELKGPCTYKCDQYGEWDPDEGKCIFHDCIGELPQEGIKLNNENALPPNDTTEYFYSISSDSACAYSCQTEKGYHYDPVTDKCILNKCDIANTSVNDLDVFIVSSTGEISHFTMMDRNLGATQLFNQNYASPNKSSYGCFFQWGNNYGFPNEGSITTSSEMVDASEFGPNHYYNNGIFITNYNGWDSSYNKNLWGGETSTASDKQGPCKTGYHVPDTTEWNDIEQKRDDANISDTPQKWASDLLLPFAGYRNFSNSNLSSENSNGLYRSSSAGDANHAYYITNNGTNKNTHIDNAYSLGLSLRCFKDFVSSSTLNIHPNGGTNAVISVDWETTGSGKIMTLGEPIKTGYRFMGWFSDEGFTNKVNNGDYIPDNSNLYASWQEADAMFMKGSGFNQVLIALAGNKDNILKIERASTLTEGTTRIISSSESGIPIYAWFNEGTIYYYSAAEKIYLNPDSSHMFSNLTNLTSIDTTNWDTSKVVDMSVMFYRCNNLTEIDVNDRDTSNVINMSYMFYSCISLEELDVSKWNIGNVTDISNMFAYCEHLTNLDLSKWDTHNVTNMNSLFWGCKSLTKLDLNNWNTSNVTDMKYTFIFCSNLEELNINNWDTHNVTNMHDMFQGCTSLTKLDLNNWDTSNVKDMALMFSACRNLTELNINNWDTHNVTDMHIMFDGCRSLTELDLNNWDTSNVTDMNYMFNSCINLRKLNIGNWDTSKVTNMDRMFFGCENLEELDVSNLDTSNVTDMEMMFYGCNNLTELDVSNWDTSKVTTMEGIFRDVSATKLDVSNWDTHNVTDMRMMFDGCDKLTELDVSNWDTSNVTNMLMMFSVCENLTELDLSNWDTSNVTDMRYMFSACFNLKTIYASEKFTTDNVTQSTTMFNNDKKLVGGNGTNYSSLHIDKEYARIDRPGTPGYFTSK